MRAGIRTAVAIGAVAILMLSCFVPVSRGQFVLNVVGFLKDSEGNPIPLARITMSGQTYNMSTEVMEPLVKVADTDAYGYYSIATSWGMEGFYSGSTVTVSYVTGEGNATETFVVTSELNTLRYKWVNLTYEPSTGLLDVLKTPVGLAGIVAVVSIVIIGYFIVASSKGDETLDPEKPARVERRRRRR